MKTVITYGVFDLYHKGHERLLERAKALGDRLIVGVTSDDFALERGKPFIVDPMEKRMKNVASSGFADEVIVEDHFGQKVEDVQKYGADLFVIGDDWTGKFDFLKQWCEVIYLPRTPGISSSAMRNRNYNPLRIGIIGCGRAAHRFVREFSHIPRGIELCSVYHPAHKKADAFAEESGIEFASSKIQEFLSHIDAVYIASPNGAHYEQCRASLEAGKHVLCEKPMVLSEAQTTELFSLAREKKLVLMEAIKTAYCPGFIRVIALAQSGAIGTVTDVESCFTRLTEPTKRELTDKEFGGSLTEFGSYTLLPAVKLLGTEELNARFQTVLDANGVDLYTKVIMENAGRFALSKTGLGAKSEGEMIIAGTTGYILVKAPWWKTTDFEIHYEDPLRVDKFHMLYLDEGIRYELSDFIGRIQGYGKDIFKLSEKESAAIAKVMEQFLAYRESERRRLGL